MKFFLKKDKLNLNKIIIENELKLSVLNKKIANIEEEYINKILKITQIKIDLSLLIFNLFSNSLIKLFLLASSINADIFS